MLVYQIEQLELESVAAARFEYAGNGDDLNLCLGLTLVVSICVVTASVV